MGRGVGRGGEWDGGPRPRVSPCLVKYHLIPREIRFNFTRHNTPAASFVLSVSLVHVRQWSELHLQRLIVEKGNSRFVDRLIIVDEIYAMERLSRNWSIASISIWQWRKWFRLGKNLDVGNEFVPRQRIGKISSIWYEYLWRMKSECKI